MSRETTWMPLYIGDYLADTMHLGTVEHGAYMLLLMHAWRTGPLPDNDRALAAIARADGPTWRRIGSTVRAFFTAGPTGLTQKRMEAIRAEQQGKIEQASAAGKASAEARKAKREAQQNSNARSTPVAVPLQQNGQRNANLLELEIEEEKKEISLPSEAHLGETEDAAPKSKPRRQDPMRGFDEFWRVYPRKVGKGAAEKAWPKALDAAGGDADEILMAVKVAIGTDLLDMREDGRFCPHASTWLSRKGWLDGMEPEPPAQPNLIPRH